MGLHGNIFWGSIQIGELLATEKSQFNCGTSLMPQDIKFRDEAMSLWKMSPKVYKRQGGNIVEVWEVKEIRCWDLVVAMRQ